MFLNKRLISLLSIVAVLVVGVTTMLLLSSFQPEAEPANSTAETRLVRTMDLPIDSHELWIRGDGFLVASRNLNLQLPIPGQIQYAYEDLQGGVAVKQDQLLIALDSRRAENAYEAARFGFIRLASTFIVQAGLSGTTKSEWDSLISRLETMDIAPGPLPGELPETSGRSRILASSLGVLDAWYALDRAAMDYNDHFLTSPFSGILIGDGVQTSSWIAAGQVLASVTDTSNLEVRASLPLSDLELLETGTTVEIVREGGDRMLNGTLSRIEPSLSSASQTGRVLVTAENNADNPWLPGSFVRLRMQGPTIASGSRIPRSLLISGQLPILREGKLALEPVRILAYQDDEVIIAPDFPGNTSVVTTVLQAPLEGMELRSEDSTDSTLQAAENTEAAQ